MKKSNQILMVAPTLGAGGGTERVLVNLSNGLINHIGIIILVRRFDDKITYDLDPRILILKLSKARKPNRYPKLNRLLLLHKVLRLNLKYPITKIISFSNSISLDLSRILPKKIIAGEHWPLSKYSQPSLLKKIKKYYPRIYKIVLLNQNEYNAYSNLLGTTHNLEIIYNFSIKDDGTPETKENIILSIAHFNEQKRNDLLIQAWNELTPKFEDWHLQIIGEGNTFQECYELIKRLKLEERITIIPRTNKSADFYRKAKVFVLSSEYEALPMVLIEAKSYGVPCVSFDVISGPSEIIRDGKDGLLAVYPNFKDLAKKIEYLLDNEKVRERMSREAEIDYINRFSEEELLKKWLNIIFE